MFSTKLALHSLVTHASAYPRACWLARSWSVISLGEVARGFGCTTLIARYIWPLDKFSCDVNSFFSLRNVRRVTLHCSYFSFQIYCTTLTRRECNSLIFNFIDFIIFSTYLLTWGGILPERVEPTSPRKNHGDVSWVVSTPRFPVSAVREVLSVSVPPPLFTRTTILDYYL